MFDLSLSVAVKQANHSRSSVTPLLFAGRRKVPRRAARREEEPCSYCEECGAEIAGEVNVGEDGLFYCDDCWANCDDDGDDSGELWDFADAVLWF